ncbi:endoplasmic reticulum oxidoreductin 1 [Basidiobolus meristosporus CBS 931.73]|uniref:Endoplasmic reticulum oxidoreductin 1 n=1 Tax=Basidiobolus meristosporus CBS 931.73 TaxID=1314790 RepID=A0A1Y1YTV6_9FUNG|nr:endoplasmic reticulum oxidoreductin 1 [Basidiobolus meristosporus CBS 931.73]|eukprot:ORY01399.1 endoplasmic reticulum oxidoreductin 1 [Basidiobolus meristosporus CBS 931.73]
MSGEKNEEEATIALRNKLLVKYFRPLFFIWVVSHAWKIIKYFFFTPTPYPDLDVLSSINKNSYLPVGLIEGTSCDFEAIRNLNEKLSPELHNLVQTPFFRYYKLNLYKQCPFWPDNYLCNREDCNVEVMDEVDVPEALKNKLSAIDFSPAGLSFQPFKKCEFTNKDFCVLEDEASQDGIFVDLIKNPERFTGFAGPPARKIWQAVYEENCFSPIKLISDANDHVVPMTNAFMDSVKEEDKTCLEERVFYRLISGLHTSVSVHICDEYFDQATGQWGTNLECFHERVGRYPERIENMYFNYAIILRALNKMSTYLQRYDYCSGDPKEDHNVKVILDTILALSKSLPSTFNEKVLFSDPTAALLKEEFKDHFRNVTRIMDCVGCEKCRLWGKIQTSGLGTALKVLFSYDEHKFGPRASPSLLQRSELVALLNTFNRFSESIAALQRLKK